MHGELFGSAELDLGASSAEHALSNEELLLSAYGGSAPTALVEKLWSFGRYLLIASSRETGQPCPLLGLWHGDYRAFWSFVMLNENLQMCYWQALSGNMPRLLPAVFDYFEGMMDEFRENARKLYGCRGILIPAVTTPGEGLMQCLAPHIVAWTGGAGWLAQHYYDYYLCTRDREFLVSRALPFLREVALFYEDFLVPGDDGLYVSVPSVSPENTPGNWLPEGKSEGIRTTINATMGFAIVRELLRNLIEGSRIAGVYAEEIGTWERMLARVPPYQVNADGAVSEWMHPLFEDNYHHRHQSHIYPLFPGVEVTEEQDPDLFQAFVTAIRKRLVIGLTSQTSWSLDHMACVYARMREAELAVECLDLISRSCVMNNLFTVHNDWRGMGVGMEMKHAPFQIDANMGWSAAVPERWRRGRVTGLLCRGGALVDLEWDRERCFMAARLRAREAQTVTVTLPRGAREIAVRGGKHAGAAEARVEGLELPPGVEVHIEARLQESAPPPNRNR